MKIANKILCLFCRSVGVTCGDSTVSPTSSAKIIRMEGFKAGPVEHTGHRSFLIELPLIGS